MIIKRLVSFQKKLRITKLVDAVPAFYYSYTFDKVSNKGEHVLKILSDDFEIVLNTADVKRLENYLSTDKNLST